MQATGFIRNVQLKKRPAVLPFGARTYDCFSASAGGFFRQEKKLFSQTRAADGRS